jgi:glycosyltransferase involved in cell wall biosynthesis
MNPKTSALTEDARKDLKKIREAEILIGIPSYQSIHSIGRVVKACLVGLAKYFPDKRGLIFISEGGDAVAVSETLRDLSVEEAFDQNMITVPKARSEVLVTDYRGIPGKGTAVKAIFEAAGRIGARACAVLDSDLQSISPEWVQLLIAPVLVKGFGFVTPYYSRHKYDGTITNLIAYPMTRALYGRRVRQPIGGDFGFSPQLAESLLKKEFWNGSVARFGIDIWMTTVAIKEGFRICQSFLGAKIHDDKDPGKDLAPMFLQVVGTLFALTRRYESEWIHVLGSRPTAIFGFETEVSPRPVPVDVENLKRSFREAVPSYRAEWQDILEPGNYYKLMEVCEEQDRYFELPFEVWVKSIYDFAVAYPAYEGNPETILAALLPIYYAAVASFVVKTKEMDNRRVEELINRQCETFENLKPYLIQRWEAASQKRRG